MPPPHATARGLTNVFSLVCEFSPGKSHNIPAQTKSGYQVYQCFIFFLLVVEIKSNGYSPTHHCRFYVNQTPSKCFLTVTDGVLGATPSEDMPQSSLTVRHHVKVHNAHFDFSIMVRSFSRWFEGSNSCVRGLSGAGAINPTSTRATYALHTIVGALKPLSPLLQGQMLSHWCAYGMDVIYKITFQTKCAGNGISTENQQLALIYNIYTSVSLEYTVLARFFDDLVLSTAVQMSSNNLSSQLSTFCIDLPTSGKSEPPLKAS